MDPHSPMEPFEFDEDLQRLANDQDVAGLLMVAQIARDNCTELTKLLQIGLGQIDPEEQL